MSYPPGSESSSTPADQPSSYPPFSSPPPVTPDPEPVYVPPAQPAYSPPPVTPDPEPVYVPPAQPAYSPPPVTPEPEPVYVAPAQPAYSPPPAYAAPPGSYNPVPGQPGADPAAAAPTSQYPPMPAPPTYDPAAVAAAQYSAPPVSGPYGYGMPPMMMPVAPPARKGKATVVLAVLTTLFLLTTGVLGTLFVLKNQEASKFSTQVTQLTSDNASQKTKLDSNQRELDSTKRDLADSDDQLQEMTTQRKALADCINSIVDANRAFHAAGDKITPQVQALDDASDRLCTAAEKYL